MRRPSYGAVTGVTAAMALLAFVRVALVRLIPPPHPEIAEWGRGEFVQRAEAQDVPWRPLGRKAFEDARRLSRPVLIVVGVPWSAVGRQADRSFAVPEVARALGRNFVPIRVDAAQDPRWLSQFLPLQRTHVGFSVGFQGWVFDLKGRLIAFIGRFNAGEALDEATVVEDLSKAREAFGRAVLSDKVPDLQADQDADAERLTTPGVTDLSLANAAKSLLRGIDPAWGGWNVGGLVGSRPLALRFLQLAGEWDGAGASLRHGLLSSRADWLDGGFFRVVRREDGVPEYDKPTLANAQFAEVLAVQDAARPDPLLRRAAQRAVRWILGLLDDGFLPGAEVGDEDARGRSGRASFSPRRLRDAVRDGKLSPEDVAWAQEGLGLDGRRSPALVAVPTAQAAASPRLEPVLTALARAAGPRRARVAPALCNVNAAAAACLLRCARLWGDGDLAATGGDLVDRIGRRFVREWGVAHTLNAAPEDPLHLSDALAYADAALQDFLTNGRVPSLESGAAALRRALRTFGDRDRSYLRASAASSLLPGLANLAALPQATDDECEASSATALRLLDAYATVLGPSGKDLAGWAGRLDDRLGAVTEAAPALGGALGALARHLDARAAIVVGPDATARAARLARRFPNRLVVPVMGLARRDLDACAPGVYITTSSGIAGPFTERSLAERLPADLEVGL